MQEVRQLAPQSGAHQIVRLPESLEEFVAIATDENGDPVNGVVITWRLQSGDGEIQFVDWVTGPDGTARMCYKQRSPDVYHIECHASGMEIEPAMFIGEILPSIDEVLQMVMMLPPPREQPEPTETIFVPPLTQKEWPTIRLTPSIPQKRRRPVTTNIPMNSPSLIGGLKVVAVMTLLALGVVTSLVAFAESSSKKNTPATEAAIK